MWCVYKTFVVVDFQNCSIFISVCSIFISVAIQYIFNYIRKSCAVSYCNIYVTSSSGDRMCYAIS